MIQARVIFAAACLLSLSACDDPQTARRTLDDAGYSDIQAGGYDPWKCGRDDLYSTHFTALNPAGRRVSGTVCSAPLKGGTIRF